MWILCCYVNIEVRVHLHNTDSIDVLEGGCPGSSCGSVDTSLIDNTVLLRVDILVD